MNIFQCFLKIANYRIGCAVSFDSIVEIYNVIVFSPDTAVKLQNLAIFIDRFIPWLFSPRAYERANDSYDRCCTAGGQNGSHFRRIAKEGK